MSDTSKIRASKYCPTAFVEFKYLAAFAVQSAHKMSLIARASPIYAEISAEFSYTLKTGLS